MSIYDYTHVKQPTDFSTEPQYAIVTFGSYSVPGDERSRTHPGHGYPAHDISTLDIRIYKTEAAWLAEIQRRATERYSSEAWAPLIIRRPEVQMSVHVAVKG